MVKEPMVLEGKLFIWEDPPGMDTWGSISGEVFTTPKESTEILSWMEPLSGKRVRITVEEIEDGTAV